MRGVNTLSLGFISTNRHKKLVDVLKMSHLTLKYFFDVDSKSIIINLVRFGRKFV